MKSKKRIKGIMLLVLFLMFPLIQVEAAGSASISSSDSVEVGNNVTATITLKNMAAWNLKATGSGSTSGCSIHEVGDSGNGNNTTKYFKITCKATNVGSITFSYGGDVTSSDGSNTNISGSKKVNVVKPREKSTNNNLKSLSVEGYSLSPEFSKDTLEYTTELPADATKIQINASKEDGYASLDGTGEKEVQEGENRFEITVTSETGKSKTYVIIANVKDNNPIEKEVDSTKLTVVKRSDSLVKPNDYFVEHKVTINDIEIPAFYNEKTNTVLIGLKDETGKIELYIYQEKEDKYIKYQSITSSNPTIIFKESKNIPDGYQKTTLKIDENSYEVYKSDKNKNYFLIYGFNIETGEENWYSYHENEKTIQVYSNQEVEELTDDYDKKLEEYEIIIIGLGVLSIFLLFIILILVLKRSKKTKHKKEMISSKEEFKIEEESEENILDEKPKKKRKK